MAQRNRAGEGCITTVGGAGICRQNLQLAIAIVIAYMRKINCGSRHQCRIPTGTIEQCQGDHSIGRADDICVTVAIKIVHQCATFDAVEEIHRAYPSRAAPIPQGCVAHRIENHD